MEPRARAGKNVGKMNFGNVELSSLLYGCGDVRHPLPESMKVLDEIATEFIQGLSFEAARTAQYSGRQKVKYEDFEFSFRRNPQYLGRVQEVFELKKHIAEARKAFNDETLLKDTTGLKQLAADAGVASAADGKAESEAGSGGGGGGGGARSVTGRSAVSRGKKRKHEDVAEDEELGDQDDDLEALMDLTGKKR
ncbi:hypothetical protein RB598_000261 [Gaeumannomyces tritici]